MLHNTSLTMKRSRLLNRVLIKTRWLSLKFLATRDPIKTKKFTASEVLPRFYLNNNLKLWIYGSTANAPHRPWMFHQGTRELKSSSLFQSNQILTAGSAKQKAIDHSSPPKCSPPPPHPNHFALLIANRAEEFTANEDRSRLPR